MNPLAARLCKRLTLGLLAFLLTSCAYVTLQAPQLSAVRALFPSQATVDFAPFLWSLRWAGSEQPVIPVAVGEQVVFTHESGVQVSFDGWNVTRVAGLLGQEPITLSLDEQQMLRIAQGFATIYEGLCGGWVEEGSEYVQRCEGLAPRRITLDDSKTIQALSFVIHPDYPPLLLYR